MDYEDYKAGKSESSFWFKARRNLIFQLLSKKRIKDNVKILSIGVGTGDELEVLNKFGEVSIIDINKKALDLIPKKLFYKKQVGDARNLSFKEKSFDIVVAFDVLEHIKEDNLVIKEIYRVLKQNGIFFFSVPAFQFMYSSHDKALNHYRRYSKKHLKLLLKNFKQTKMNYWNSFLFLPICLTRILKKNSPPKVDDDNVSSSLDFLFLKLLNLENFLISKNISFPFGVSIFGICRR